MPHPDKTCFADRVVYFKDSTPHVGFVMKTHDDDPHMACLVYYCGNHWLSDKEYRRRVRILGEDSALGMEVRP